MSTPTISRPTNSRGNPSNNALIVTDAHGNDFMFSYQTVIGFRGHVMNEGDPFKAYTTARRANSWGPTTGRHFGEIGCKGYETLSDEDFAALLERVA